MNAKKSASSSKELSKTYFGYFQRLRSFVVCSNRFPSSEELQGLFTVRTNRSVLRILKEMKDSNFISFDKHTSDWSILKNLNGEDSKAVLSFSVKKVEPTCCEEVCEPVHSKCCEPSLFARLMRWLGL